jgi:hypothetical protein
MVQWLRLIGFFALIAVGALVFELQNIWPFNGDRILMLRLIFAACSLAAIAALAWRRFRFLPAILLAVAFVVTSALSRADITAAYLLAGTLLVTVAAMLGQAGRSPIAH